MGLTTFFRYHQFLCKDLRSPSDVCSRPPHALALFPRRWGGIGGDDDKDAFDEASMRSYPRRSAQPTNSYGSSSSGIFKNMNGARGRIGPDNSNRSDLTGLSTPIHLSQSPSPVRRKKRPQVRLRINCCWGTLRFFCFFFVLFFVVGVTAFSRLNEKNVVG